jgi:DNA helicase II / ATP-dependent DNA helicase PcrA
MSSTEPDLLSGLNPAQCEAVTYAGDAPLLVIAGAGSGKTNTLAHRVAHLIAGGADPRRLLLLTFTRRAAAEMTRRARNLLGHGGGRAGDIRWSGTFHAIGNRLLRLHAHAVGLDPSFTVLDRSDAADLLDLVRNRLGLAKKERRFPRKATCLAIYSRAVGASEPVEDCLARSFPWCEEWAEELRRLFRAYVEAKQQAGVLDYDDLLLYWYHLVQEPALAAQVGARFDHVLVDEYQDTNTLQAAILRALRPSGEGLTAVGDDAQAIYSFRAASVRNILEFPHAFITPARVVSLEQNYRSTQPILDASNAVLALATEGYEKHLRAARRGSQKPILCTAEDEQCEVDYVVERVLEAREAGVPLKRQAVLFRTAHHSDLLEVELGRRKIPFVKFGGLKFLEAAHVKDVLCVLRWAENPRDTVAAFRVLKLLPGVGPAAASRVLDHVTQGGSLGELAGLKVPAAAREAWPGLCALLAKLTSAGASWKGQLGAVRGWYEPYLETRYDAAGARRSDLEQLEQLADGYDSRERFLSELTLDPPEATGDLAGLPLLDEDYLILSTIHSAKGQEWDAVYVLHVADGCIPSDMSTGNAEQIEEERRLLYVAMTRARDELHLVHPLRFYVRQQHRHGDRHLFSPRSRFLPDEVLDRFERTHKGRASVGEGAPEGPPPVRIDVGARLRDMF